MINAETATRLTARFDCPAQKDPIKRAKGLPILGKTEIAHIMDRESEDVVHTRQFETTLNRMRDAGGLVKKSNIILVTPISLLSCGLSYTR